jgi:hypothetical protein
VTRLVALLVLLAAVAAPAASGANFNKVTTNADVITADSADSYLRVFSQGSDPAGLLGYAPKLGSVPLVPAATGTDTGVKVALGGYKNVAAAAVSRAFAIQAFNPLPAGVASLTVTASLVADAATGKQPLSAFSLSKLDGTGAGPSIVLAAGDKAQLNLTIRTNGPGFGGSGKLYSPAVELTVTYPGYTGTFLTYVIPVTVWDGIGAGP